MRSASIKRDTKETQITLSIELDGTGKSELATGCGFLDHMLTLFARHGDFDLTVACHGDTEVDYHHTVEDIGICLGQAFMQALGRSSPAGRRKRHRFHQRQIHRGAQSAHVKWSKPGLSSGLSSYALVSFPQLRLGPGDVSRVRRWLIREYSPGIGFPHPLSVVSILYHKSCGESERFVKYA